MNKDIDMGAEAIIVNGGQFLIGSKDNPYTRNGQITLHGNWHSFKLPLCGIKTIFQTRGMIEMHGKPVDKTWVELAATAEAGATKIELLEPPGWKRGDKIVLAGTDDIMG